MSKEHEETLDVQQETPDTNKTTDENTESAVSETETTSETSEVNEETAENADTADTYDTSDEEFSMAETEKFDLSEDAETESTGTSVSNDASDAEENKNDETSKDAANSNEDSAAGESPQEEQTEVNGNGEEAPVNNRILAIKSALRQREEEEQQEEMQHAIADKIRKYKTAKDNPSEADAASDNSGTTEKSDEKSRKSIKKQKSKNKKSGKKSVKKKKGFLGNLFPSKGDGALEVMRKCIFLSSSAIFVVCLCMIGDYFWDNYQNAQLSDNLRDIYTQEVEEPTDPMQETISPDENYEYYAYLNGAEKLLEINPDVCGWLVIPGTQINYPVLQRKGQEDGNDYYLKRNINGENAHAGSIFMDFRNEFDNVVDHRKQVDNSTNLIIYGHNMHDYSMFGSLKHYINDADYYGEHPIVELNSNYRRYKYKIFGMIIVDIDDETETKFDYWNQLNFDSEQAFYDYVNEVKRRTIRLNDVDVTYGDQLLTLSTCNSTFSDGRLVIFARLLRDGEDLYEGTQNSVENPNIKWPNSYYRWHKNTYDPDAEFVPYG